MSPSHNWHSSVSHRCVAAPYSGFMESERQAWNDERMDEFSKRTEENFREVRAEMNVRFAGLESKLDRRFDILFGALATGFIGAVVSHFLG